MLSGMMQALPNAQELQQGLGVMSPLLMAMSQNLLTPVAQRSPQNMQAGMMMMQQHAQRKAQADAYKQLLGQGSGGAPLSPVAEGAPLNPSPSGQPGGLNIPPQLAAILGQMPPEQGMGILAQHMMRPEQDGATAGMREYEMARQQGFQGSFLDFQGALAEARRREQQQDPYERYRVVGGGLVDLGAEGGPQQVLEPQQRDSATEQRIARLMSTGMPLETAIGIADGRLVTSRDPISGQVQVVDKATGRAVGQLPEGAAVAQDTRAPSIPTDVDFSLGTGVGGLVAGVANTYADLFNQRLPAPEAERAIQALTNLQVRTQTMLQDAVPGRPSNYLMERLGALTVGPSDLTMGPQRARERFTQTRDMIAEAIRTNESVLANRGDFLPKQVADARLKIVELTPLLRDYDAVIAGLGKDQPQQFQDGQRARNPQTGETLVFRSGRWVPE